VNLFGWTISIESRSPFYYFAFALVCLSVAGLKRILDSPFGSVLRAIRENGDRAAACGYDVRRIKHLSFVFSALFAGLAGALRRSPPGCRARRVPLLGHVGAGGDHDAPRWRGHVLRPLRRRGTFLLLEDRLSAFTERWPIAIGLIFMTFVLFLPKGIWGTLTGGRHGHQSA